MGLHVLVLAGGSGTRLWPLSRAAMPKHLLPLAPGGRTLLRATLERVSGLGDSVRVVTAAAQADRCTAELVAAGLPGDALIAEPTARGTGPALGLAVAEVARDDPAALIASVHADARVMDANAYRAALVASAGWAAVSGGLATVGLRPTSAATGFGYIEVAEALPASDWRPPSTLGGQVAAEAAALPASRAAGFTEKPAREAAERYLAGGRHLWNMGLFAWPAAHFLAELEAADAALHATLERVVDARRSGDEATAAALYSGLRSVPVEPLVLERGGPLIAVHASFDWSDLGSWADLHRSRADSGEADPAGNVADGDVLLIDAAGCTVESRGGRLVAVAGARDLVVVDTPDALLVVPRGESQRVKEVVERLREQGRGKLT